MPEDLQERGAEIMAQLVAGESWPGEFLMRRRDGTTFQSSSLIRRYAIARACS